MMTSLSIAAAFLVLHPPGPLPAQVQDFNTLMMNATIKLANTKSTATGFLLTRPAPGPSGKPRFVLVTAAHVFEQMEGAEAILFFRHKEAEGVYRKLPFKLIIRKDGKTLWTKHPLLDIAAVEIVPPDGAEVPRVPLDVLATDDALRRYEVHPGDSLMCLGYPHRMEANDAGFPVLRRGAIASFPLLPSGKNRTFLLNYNSFEGDSGGPVYLAETNRFLSGKNQPVKARLILGLVLGQHFMNEQVRTVYETRQVRHRLGLAIIVQATFIRETIDRLPQKP